MRHISAMKNSAPPPTVIIYRKRYTPDHWYIWIDGKRAGLSPVGKAEEDDPGKTGERLGAQRRGHCPEP